MSKATIIASLAWIILAGVVFALFNQLLNPNQAEHLGNGQSVVLKRGTDGHYRAEAFINGQRVKVLVDTGATGVAISKAVAEQLHLSSNVAIRTSTANGEVVSYMTRLDSVKLGGVEANDVAATISPGLDGDVLLGMSFLGRMDVRLYKGEMTIKQVL